MAVRTAPRREVPVSRINLVFLLVLAAYLVLLGRLLWLQVHQGSAIRLEAARIRTRVITLPAQSGSIEDRQGRPLAVNLYSGELGFDPASMSPAGATPVTLAKLEKRLARSIQAVAPLVQMTPEQLSQTVALARARYSGGIKTRFVSLRKNVPFEVEQRLQVLKDNPRTAPTGFDLLDGVRRNYPSGENAAQVVGFVSTDGIGRAGLERACGVLLRGQQGTATAELDKLHHMIPGTMASVTAPHDGRDVVTTLDSEAQHIITEEARKIYDKFHPKGVSVVAVDPMTGDVLALVSIPNYDPNPGHTKTITPEAQWERCATMLYEPGSTLKALTIAAALDGGSISLNNNFFCSGRLQIGKKTIHCAHNEVHGSCDPAHILIHSCNIGAAQIGLRMGSAALIGADTRFGLFSRYDLPLPGVKPGRLSFDRSENVHSEAKTARVAFGQSIATTPLHVAMAYAALVNGGKLMRPRLVAELRDLNGRTLQKFEPQVIRRVISANTSAEMRRMLTSVVTEGTAKTVAMPGFTIGGKTGTAQKYRPGKFVASFVGFAPASSSTVPRAVILVAVDEPQGAYYGAEVAAPAFREITRRLMAVWRVPEDDPDSMQLAAAQHNMKVSSKHAIHMGRAVHVAPALD